jgi:hypothetical protein
MSSINGLNLLRAILHQMAKNSLSSTHSVDECSWRSLRQTARVLWTCWKQKTLGQACGQAKMRTSRSATQMLCELCTLRC